VDIETMLHIMLFGFTLVRYNTVLKYPGTYRTVPRRTVHSVLFSVLRILERERESGESV
jgi:hypothetical protein